MVNSPDNWQTLERFVEIRSSWLTLIGEKLQDDQQRILDYWRVEKADSVVIVTIQAIASNERTSRFLLPKPAYRPGVGKTTLDFPGGRVLPKQTTIETAKIILKRELGMEESNIISLEPLNQTGWEINSSFSNQKLYGLVAEIDSQTIVNPEKLTSITYTNTLNGIKNLLQDLTCLQCRAVLLEWQQSI